MEKKYELFFDEFYFHHKRGLPLWERVGHPLDTLTVLAYYLFVLVKAPDQNNFLEYTAGQTVRIKVSCDKLSLVSL